MPASHSSPIPMFHLLHCHTILLARSGSMSLPPQPPPPMNCLGLLLFLKASCKWNRTCVFLCDLILSGALSLPHVPAAVRTYTLITAEASRLLCLNTQHICILLGWVDGSSPGFLLSQGSIVPP